jgi:hypothetical protein
MLKILAAVGALVAGALAFDAAHADCTAKKPLFADRFDALDQSWGVPKADVAAEGGRLVVSPKAKSSRWAVSSAGLFADVDLCATVAAVKTGAEKGPVAGLVFWYRGNADFYVFEVAANGRAAVWRRQGGRWIAPVSWQEAAGLKAGEGAVNELRVVTRGDLATVFVNGREFGRTRGQPPEGGQQVGVFAASFGELAPVFAFDDFTVAEPSVPLAMAAKPEGAPAPQ